MSEERKIIREAQKQMREKLRGEMREQLREEMREKQFQPEQLRVVRRAFIVTVIAALVFFIVEFAEYMPFYPKGAYVQKQCTVISVEYRRSGRSGDYKTTWLASDGAQYTMSASRKDYIGRTETLYTKRGSAIRMQYEIPKAFLMWGICIILIPAFLVLEIRWFIKYKQYQKKGEEP